MSETLELQKEEREALASIYEGDSSFKQINTTSFQYKYGENETSKSFLIEINWPEDYPNMIPALNLDVFYNQNLSKSARNKIVTILNEEAEQWLGCGMTYTLFEFLKDKVDDILADVSEAIVTPASGLVEAIDILDLGDNANKNIKKEQLTKAQKRRAWNNSDHKGVKQRGWDWIDIVKHLSQTGVKDDVPLT